MNRTRDHIVHYISATKYPTNYANSFDRSNNLLHKRIKQVLLDKNKIPIQKKYKFIEIKKYSNNNINEPNFINVKNPPNNFRNTQTYQSIFNSKKNCSCMAKISNSVDKLKKDNHFCDTPKKHISANIKTHLKENNMSHQRCNTTTNIKKNNIVSFPRTYEIKSMKIDNKKINNLIKNIKIQPKIRYKKLNLQNQKNKEKNKNNLEKLKNVAKKIKYDLNSINGLESKQERIKNLLYGISYMTEKKECELCHKIVDRHTYQFHYFSHPSPILNWMFLGTFKNGHNLEEIKTLGIKYILNCAIEIKPRNLPNHIKYCHLNLTDSPSADITKYFDQAFSFIESARKKNQKILIHCKLGVSRSPALLMGYFIKYMGYTTKSSLDFLRSKRSQVYPNIGFINQLYSYERTIRKNQREYLVSNLTNSTADFSISKL